PVGRLLEHGDTLARHILHPSVVMNVAEQQITAFLPPDRSFSGSHRAAEAIGQLLDGLGRRDDLVQLWSELLDPLGRLGQYATDATSHGQAAYCHSHPQNVSA